MSERVYPLKDHSELEVPLKDLEFVTAAILEAQRNWNVSQELMGTLAMMRLAILQTFWNALYRCTPFSEKDRLEFCFRDGEPILIVHEGDNAAEASDARVAIGAGICN